MTLLRTLSISFVLVILWAGPLNATDAQTWNASEIRALQSLWIGSLPPLPDDPSNKYADDYKAIALGKKLFFDARLSANGKVACATCHIEDKSFTDNLPVAHGIEDTSRRSMPLAGMAYSPWLFWDGRADSLWAQALGPIENPVEHGISRTKCVLLVNEFYRKEYKEIFGDLPEISNNDFNPKASPVIDDKEAKALWISMSPDKQELITRLYANIGKSIGAFVRTIQPGKSSFDRYAEAVFKGDMENMEKILTDDEAFGLKLFIGKAQCINCHNGPLFTNNDFHDVGVPKRPKFDKDPGREQGIPQVLSNEFNCLGKYSDADPDECLELQFIDTDAEKYRGAMKTPSLRNVADRPPYMHAGQFATLSDVMKFYQKQAAGKSGADTGRPDIVHGILSDNDLVLLEAFLKKLDGPIYSAR